MYDTNAMSGSTMADTSDDNNQIAHFEKSLDELEQLVSNLEQGDLSLDESLKSFERGVALFRDCQSALEQAELRVKLLMDPEDADAAEPFDENPDSDNNTNLRDDSPS